MKRTASIALASLVATVALASAASAHHTPAGHQLAAPAMTAAVADSITSNDHAGATPLAACQGVTLKVKNRESRGKKATSTSCNRIGINQKLYYKSGIFYITC